MKTLITVKELDELSAVTLLDVRKRPAFDEDDVIIEGATWRDPFEVAQWGPGLAGDSPGGPVICYCVHGHEVSQGAAALRDLGIDACYLEGGIGDWKAAGRRLGPKP